jgi:hypothetical protein
VLRLARGDALPLALRELQLLLGEAELLVDLVRGLGQLLHLALVLEELQPLRRQSRLQPRQLRLGHLLGVARIGELGFV